MNETTQVIKAEADSTELSLEQVKRHVNLVQIVMRDVMQEGEHYGRIPGCGTKPCLLKPGAEKLNLTFRLAPSYEVRRTDLPGGHREYEVICTLTSIATGAVLGQGVGSCSTMESKYRYRVGEIEFVGIPVPSKYWQTRDKRLLGGEGFVPKKNPETGKWEIAKQQRVDHDNPADYYNTVLKMAKKRAHVDAILTVTAASDIFTQDIEELAENGEVHAEVPTVQKAKPDPFEQMILAANLDEGSLELLDEYLAEKTRETGKDISAVKRAALRKPEEFFAGFFRWRDQREEMTVQDGA